MIEADNELRAYSEWRSALREATDRAEGNLNEAICTDPDRIIVEHLRPAHTSALKVAKTHAAVASLVDPAVMSKLPTGLRTKADALAQAAAQYVAVRAAWTALTRPGLQQRNDNQGVFGELYDLPEVWSTYRQRGQDFPWPTEPVARLVWIAAHAKPWCPTVDEQEARWHEVYGEALEQAAHNRHAMRGFAALGGRS